MAVILNPSPAAKTAPLEKTFDSLDRGLRGLGPQPRPPFCMLFATRPLTSPLTLSLGGLGAASKNDSEINPALEPRVIKDMRRLGFGMRRRRLETGVVIESRWRISLRVTTNLESLGESQRTEVP